MTAQSGMALQRYLGSSHVRWLIDENLVTEDGMLTAGGRRLAHFLLVAAEFQLRPRTAADGRDG